MSSVRRTDDRLPRLVAHRLTSSYAHGRIYRDGVSVVLAGEPTRESRASSMPSEQDRAIVTLCRERRGMR
jgi:hypothetical protein